MANLYLNTVIQTHERSTGNISSLWFKENGEIHSRFSIWFFRTFAPNHLQKDQEKFITKLAAQVQILDLKNPPANIDKIRSVFHSITLHFYKYFSFKNFTSFNQLEQHLTAIAVKLEQFPANPIPQALFQSNTDINRFAIRSPQGLPNRGLTCFANATLQLLRNSPSIQALLKNHIVKENSENSLSFTLRCSLKNDLLKILQLLDNESQLSQKDPNTYQVLKRSFDREVSQLLDVVWNTFNSLMKLKNINFHLMGMQEDAKEFLDLLLQLLGGDELKNASIYSLPLKEEANIQEIFNAFFNPNENAQGKAISEIEQLQNTELFVHFDRCKENNSKNSLPLHNWNQPIQVIFHPIKNPNQTCTMVFKPIDVICHHGTSFQRGHYTEVHINENGMLTHNNDSQVYTTNTDKSELDNIAKTCYLIRYQVSLNIF